MLGGSRVVLGLCWGILGGCWANKFILPESGQAWQNAFRGLFSRFSAKYMGWVRSWAVSWEGVGYFGGSRGGLDGIWGHQRTQPTTFLHPKQPATAFLSNPLPRLRQPAKGFMVGWWMMHYGHSSPKRSKGWSNCRTILDLNLGRLSRKAMKKSSKPLAVGYIDAKGRRRWHGSKHMKNSQFSPQLPSSGESYYPPPFPEHLFHT